MDRFLLEIVTPRGLFLSEEVEEFVAPGIEGEFGVLPGHAYFMTSLKAGELHYKKDGRTFSMAANGGYAQVLPDKVIVLTEGIERK